MLSTSGDTDGSPRPRRVLPGRAGTVARLAADATSARTPPLLLVTGPGGIGRSALLAAVRETLTERGVRVLDLRLARNERDRHHALAARLAAELGTLHRAEDGRRPAHTAPVAPQPEAGRDLTAALRSAVASGETLVVLIDDLQWADAASRGTLLARIRSLTGGPVTFVCGYRTTPGGTARDRAALDRLRAAGLVRVVPLRPLCSAEVDTLVAHTVRARPSAALAARLRRDCRGVPAAVLAAVAGYRREGALRVLQRHACLTSPERPPAVPDDLPLVEHLRHLGDRPWSVAKALAVLHPLGPPAVGLIARALETDEEEVREQLELLRAEGVLWCAGGRWRFRLPLLGYALAGCLGQFERRRLSQLAVTAVWAGEAVADDHVLAEHLVTAGRFVDSRRAAGELVTRGRAALLHDGHHAVRWLRAALDLTTEPEQRAAALLLHATACCIHLRHAEAMESAWTVLSRYTGLVTSEDLFDMEAIWVVSAAGVSDTTALAALAEERWRTLPGGEGHRIVARCLALCHLERWREAVDHLTATREIWSRENDLVAAVGQVVSETGAALLGRTAALDRSVDDPTRYPLWHRGGRHRFQRLTSLARVLMQFNELDRAEALLAGHHLPSGYRPIPDRVVADSHAGHWDRALDLARTALAADTWVGELTSHTMASRELSTILAARGRLTEARAVIEQAKSVHSLLLHLLAVPESEWEQILGGRERSLQVITEALALAGERGLVVGTDELWLRRAEAELVTGDPAAARRSVAEVIRVAELTGTSRAQLCRHIGVAMMEGDRTASAEAVRLARRRNQPLELADTLQTVVRLGQADPALLREAYGLYGDLDALMRKAQLRNLMREQNISVPDRSATTSENERLLAVLVTEGLTNREMSIALGCSEKSVESRLTRLFKRAGYRSRVELASAILTGDYPVGRPG
ncbi:AAA family ATPase [Streptomyces harbinensis]|uniref:Regulatory protein, luxR family n=1 Tax=Streptomyces harbinensis TaxID=1176198 RepID=A0A1I6VHE8_9ACTN|nr:LuxR family transcriptional regulator [Streptomyces harbinensis]SFT13079.1 regulatory protein, luxR family [Streptomyces harbinensis]